MHDKSKNDLIKFVEELPTQAKCADFDESLVAMGKRYGNSTEDMTKLIGSYHDLFREATTSMLSEHYQMHGDVGIEEFSHIVERSVKAVLLRMWCYANEHATRYQFPMLLDQFTSELDGLTDPPGAVDGGQDKGGSAS